MKSLLVTEHPQLRVAGAPGLASGAFFGSARGLDNSVKPRVPFDILTGNPVGFRRRNGVPAIKRRRFA